MPDLTPGDLIRESREELARSAAVVSKLANMAHASAEPKAEAELIRLFMMIRHVMRIGIGTEDTGNLVTAHVQAVDAWIADQMTDAPTLGEEVLTFLNTR